MNGRFSYRTFFISLYLGSLIPLLVVIGLLVYGIQQRFMVNSTRSRLSEFVQAAVEPVTVTENTLNRLAVSLGDQLRVLGADVFVKDAQGEPVPPPWAPAPGWMTASTSKPWPAARVPIRKYRQAKPTGWCTWPPSWMTLASRWARWKPA